MPEKHEQGYLFDKPFEFTTGSRHVSYNVDTVTILDKTFDLHDLFSTLANVEHSDVYISNTEMCELLKKLNVLRSCGSRRDCMSALKGRRFQEFKDMVEDLSAGLDDE